MDIVHGNYIWKLYMQIIYGNYIWELYMEILYGDYNSFSEGCFHGGQIVLTPRRRGVAHIHRAQSGISRGTMGSNCLTSATRIPLDRAPLDS